MSTSLPVETPRLENRPAPRALVLERDTRDCARVVREIDGPQLDEFALVDHLKAEGHVDGALYIALAAR